MDIHVRNVRDTWHQIFENQKDLVSSTVYAIGILYINVATRGRQCD